MAFYRTVAACKLIGRDSGAAEHAFDHQSQVSLFRSDNGSSWSFQDPSWKQKSFARWNDKHEFFSTVVVSDTYQLPSMDEIGI